LPLNDGIDGCERGWMFRRDTMRRQGDAGGTVTAGLR